MQLPEFDFLLTLDRITPLTFFKFSSLTLSNHFKLISSTILNERKQEKRRGKEKKDRHRKAAPSKASWLVEQDLAISLLGSTNTISNLPRRYDSR